MWTGIGLDIYSERMSVLTAAVDFSEVAIFRNSTVVASSKVEFRLTEASPNTFGGSFEKIEHRRIEAGGLEHGAAMRICFPKRTEFPMNKVTVCSVLKEPTLAIDFEADISECLGDVEACINAIAKAINVHGNLIGERVIASVNHDVGSDVYELYVTKPYLENGLLIVNFA